MKQLILSIITFVLISNNLLLSQKIIKGFVKSEISGESLINAYVEINSKSSKIIKKTITNEYGFYKLSIPPGSYILTVSYVGYISKNIFVNISSDSTINVNLKSQHLNNVVIYSNSSSDILQDRIELGHINLDIEKIKTIPSLTGEPDILKILSLTPGVNLGVEGSSSLFVRGGTPDQNYILLDEAPVYNPAHLFGFISVFNGDALKNVDIWKSSFPARYGGRLSSVIDIKMREGNRKKRKIKYRLGLLSSSIVIEGPLSKRISYIVSGRSSYFDLFTFPLKIKYNSGKSSNYFNYRMYDLNAKMNFEINPRSKIFVSYYHGGDKIVGKQKFSNTENSSDFKWINSTVTSRFYRQLGKSMFFNAILYFSEYKQNYLFVEKSILPQNIEYDSRLDNKLSINELGAKLNFETLLYENHYIKYGCSIIKRFYKPIDMNITFANNRNINKKLEYKNSEFASFVEDEFKLSKHISSNIGIRFSGLIPDKKYNFDYEPRITIKYDLKSDYALKMGFSKMKQYINWSKPFEGSLPFDIWLPSTKNLPPQRAFHYNIGVDKIIKQRNINISLELYYKKMNNLIETKDNESPLLLLFNKDSLYQIVAAGGIGKAYGLEFFITKKTGRFNGWLAYTLAWNKRQFRDLNFGEEYPFVYDRRHDFSVSAKYSFSNKFSLSCVWVYHTGDALTLPIASYYDKEGEYRFIYGEKNSYRIPPYHRLDIGFNWSWVSKKRAKKSQLQFNIYNVYNRRNAFLISPIKKTVFDDKGLPIGKEYKIVQKSFLPILPSISFTGEI